MGSVSFLEENVKEKEETRRTEASYFSKHVALKSAYSLYVCILIMILANL